MPEVLTPHPQHFAGARVPHGAPAVAPGFNESYCVKDALPLGVRTVRKGVFHLPHLATIKIAIHFRFMENGNI